MPTTRRPPAVRETLSVAKGTPTLSITHAGGTYDGSPLPATATVAGVVPGVDNTPGPTLEGVAPSLTYFSGTYTSVAQLAGVSPADAAPRARSAPIPSKRTSRAVPTIPARRRWPTSPSSPR